MRGETQKQFLLTSGAPSTCARPNSNALSRYPKTRCSPHALALALVLYACAGMRADDGFPEIMWGWQTSTNEPAQKAIVVHCGGREVLILQLKPESDAERAGWLIPVPARPTFETISMEPFYEASRLAQQPLYPNEFTVIPEKMEVYESVMRIKEVRINRIETTTRYECVVFADAEALNRWTAINHFNFSRDQATLDAYARRGWQFVAVRADFSAMNRQSQTKPPAGNELAPLRLSFVCPKPILPLALESDRRAAPELACFTLSAEAVLSKSILAKTVAARKTEYEQWQANAPLRRNQREDCERQRAIPGMVSGLKGRDPEMDAIPIERLRAAAESWHIQFEPSRPWDVFRSEKRLLKCLPVKTEQLPECGKAATSLAESNQWVLAYHTFTGGESPAEPLEFSSAVPVLTELLQRNETVLDAADLLQPMEPKDVPALLVAAHSPNPTTRLAAAQVLSKSKDAPPNLFWLEMVKDADDKVRGTALDALRQSWSSTSLEQLFVYLRDPRLCKDVGWWLAGPPFRPELADKKDALLELTRNSDPDVQFAAWRVLLPNRQFDLPRGVLLGLLKSTNFFIINAAVSRLQEGGLSSEEASVLVHSPSPFARFASLRVLSKNADSRGIELGIELLRDREELIRVKAWQTLRKITGQHISYDQPKEWEAWWAVQTAEQKAPSLERSKQQSR
jgi:HEAT repeat protein